MPLHGKDPKDWPLSMGRREDGAGWFPELEPAPTPSSYRKPNPTASKNSLVAFQCQVELLTCSPLRLKPRLHARWSVSGASLPEECCASQTQVVHLGGSELRRVVIQVDGIPVRSRLPLFLALD